MSWSLAAVAAVMGVMSALVVRYTTSRSAMRDVWRKMQAHFLEFRLFFDEPRLVWRAQVGVLVQNARLLLLLLGPMAMLAPPMVWLLMQLDIVYGLRPIAVGESAVVTAQLARAIEEADRLDLRGSDRVAVETPAVRVEGERQVSWRIRALREGRGTVRLTVNDEVVEKSVAAGRGVMVLSPRRVSALGDFARHPVEPRLPKGVVEWVGVGYPERDGKWWVWFAVVSLAAAVVAARLM